ncbi:hypothetical protein GCM10012287_42220 [Streptomyces daqingensis]|uniref:Uncharacterized protein n=1 Tax=Streptomyces daqingensis TaxID=1472640 RepID=A0ABQ2MLJ3_9ACTN|nr:hypothetical protein GCM10012287_42220 [Streptomyces daqingensis]
MAGSFRDGFAGRRAAERRRGRTADCRRRGLPAVISEPYAPFEKSAECGVRMRAREGNTTTDKG